MPSIDTIQQDDGSWVAYAEPFNNGLRFGAKGQCKDAVVQALKNEIKEYKPDPDRVCYRKDIWDTDQAILKNAPHDWVTDEPDGDEPYPPRIRRCASCGFAMFENVELTGGRAHD